MAAFSRRRCTLRRRRSLSQSLTQLNLDVHQRAGLSQLRQLPGNEFCADCGADNPEFAELKHRVIVCPACRMVHQEMGTGVSRTVCLFEQATWEGETLEELAFFNGNDSANALMESNRPNYFPRPPPYDKTLYRRQYIYAKYQRLEFCSGSVANALDSKRADPLARRCSAVPVKTDRPPYKKDSMSIELLARCHERKDWKPHDFKLSLKRGEISVFPAEHEEKDCFPVDSINLRNSTVSLVTSSALSADEDKTVLLVNVREDDNRITSNRLQTYYLTDLHYMNKNLIEFFIAIRRYKSDNKTEDSPNEDIENVSPLCTGWLWKRRQQFPHVWKKRWFLLEGNILRYYSAPMDAFAKGEIALGTERDGYHVTSGLPPSIHRDGVNQCFMITTPNRDVMLHTSSDKEQCEKWMRVLEAICGQQSDISQSEQSCGSPVVEQTVI